MRFLNVFQYKDDTLIVRAYKTRESALNDTNLSADLYVDLSVNTYGLDVETVKRKLVLEASGGDEFCIVLNIKE